MPTLSTRWLPVGAFVGSLVFLSQHFTVDGLSQLRLTPKWSPSQANLSGAKESDWSSGTWTMNQPRIEGKDLVSRSVMTSTSTWGGAPNNHSIRVASFNIQVFNDSKARKAHVIETLAKILRQFDVVALQEISGREQDLLPRLVDRINQSGARFDYLIGPRIGRGEAMEQLAFVFDTSSIETDRYQLYTVDDPSDLLQSEPLVAWFRCREAPVEQAFTFSLVNMHLDSNQRSQELGLLSELVRSVLKDGRGEDDCILAGDFASSDREMNILASAGLSAALQGLPTTARGSEMLDNILFPSKSTCEFHGRSGVFDFLREYNLSIDAAIEISDHMPVWAEFSVIEGGQVGRS